MAYPTLTSHGFEMDTSLKKFGEMHVSNDILPDAETLQERIREEGYLLLRDYLDKKVVLAARREILQKLASVGELDERYPLMEGVCSGASCRREATGFAASLRTGQDVRAMCHQGRIVEFFERFLGGDVRSFDYIWVRTVHPGGVTGCHYDVVYMGRGTHNLYTAWIPVGDVSFSQGPLLVLENSHRLEDLKSTYGALDVDRDHDKNPYGGGWFSKNPVEVQERFGGRWLSTEFKAGDVLIFTMFTMHCSLDNRSGRIRLSTDSRYQLASDPVDERWIGESPIAHSEKARQPAPRGYEG